MDPAEQTDPGAPALATRPARERHARLYLARVRPFVIAVGALAASLDYAFGPRDIGRAELVAVGIQALAQVPLVVLLLRARVGPIRAVIASVLVDAIAITALLVAVPNPELVATCYVILVPLLGYFSTPRATLVGCVVIAGGLSVFGPLDDDWADPTVIPWSAFLVTATGITMAFIGSRMSKTEQALAERAAEEHAARMRLEQVGQSRDRLIANVSHELRTPLTSTIGAIETLLREDVVVDETTRDRLLRLARDGGLRLLLLVEDLLTLGATRPDSLDLSTAPERLASLVHDAIVGLDPGEGRAIRLDVHEDPPVRVDRMRILQVVSNLVVNGIRHGAGDVLVQTDVAAGSGVIRVSDSGAGVAPEHLDELFLPFARFSSRPDSTGLGLAICRTLVEAHGGSIRYGRTIDDRTTFTVSLPIDVAATSPGTSQFAAGPH